MRIGKYRRLCKIARQLRVLVIVILIPSSDGTIRVVIHVDFGGFRIRSICIGDIWTVRCAESLETVTALFATIPIFEAIYPRLYKTLRSFLRYREPSAGSK